MRSGYESFLRRQLSKPRTPAARFGDTVHTAPSRLGPVTTDKPILPAAPPTLLDTLEETMPAILWRAAAQAATPTPDAAPADEAFEPISLADPLLDPPPAADTLAPPLVAEGAPSADALENADSTVSPAWPETGADEPPATVAAEAEAAPAPPADAAPAPAAPAGRVPTTAAELLESFLVAALAQAQAQCGVGAAIRIGMARLDEVANAFGEFAVSHVLRALRHRLRRLLADVAPQAQVCTVGEATWIVLPGMGRTSLAEALVRQVLEALTRPVVLRGHAVALHGSAGLAVFPHDGTDPAAVRRAAEVAWRQARSRGRSAYQFYAREIESRARRRLALEARLRHAIAHNELTLHYQPRAELRTGALCGAQALPSWHPEGDGAPGGWETAELLMLAQEANLAEALAHWAIGATCRQIHTWLEQGLAVPRIGVPVLPVVFRRSGFGDLAASCARAAKVDPQRLTLLLSSAMPLGASHTALGGLDLVQHAPHLRHCRELGFHLGMDGAATHQSPLAALRALPLSELHLDSNLLADEAGSEHGGLGAAIVSLGHHLGLRAVAMGVSDESQLDRLAQLGCDEFQGPVLSDPLPAQTWAEVMAGAQRGHSTR